MMAIHRNQQLAYAAMFRCNVCDGYPDDDERECSGCDDEGEVEQDCIIEFDIDAGTPATGIAGPPEFYDPGEGPTVLKIAVSMDGEDMTHRLMDIEAAEEFVVDKWEEPAPDYPDTPEE